MTQYKHLLKNLPDFIEAALAHFWSLNPDDKKRWLSFLGQRIFEVNQGTIKEEEYIEKWMKDDTE
jgi:hypothetical protein